eukprot:5584547-Amphidinium_carterae.1
MQRQTWAVLTDILGDDPYEGDVAPAGPTETTELTQTQRLLAIRLIYGSVPPSYSCTIASDKVC